MAEQTLTILGAPLLVADMSGNKSIADTEQFIIQQGGNYTLNSTTSAQHLFSASINGQMAVLASTSYMFEALVSLTGLSNSYGFGFGGTGGATYISWMALEADAASLSTLATPRMSFWTAAGGGTVSSALNADSVLYVRGLLRISTAGTMIPQITLTSGGGVVGQDSFFRLWPIGSNTVGTVGPWT